MANNNKKLPAASAAKPLPSIKLFYSPDYKTLYETEIREMNLALLNLTDVMLTNYDYKSIDFIPSDSPNIKYDDSGAVVDYSYLEESSTTRHQSSPSVAEKIYGISDGSIDVIRAVLDIKPDSDYKDFLECFGNYKEGGQVITKNLPGYKKDGSPYYDFELTISDYDLVTEFEIYLVEEDDTI